MKKNKKVYTSLKCFFDRLVALLSIIFFLPLILCISVCILKEMGRPIFFTQKRSGYFGKELTIFKFRTMNFSRDSKGELLDDNLRLTKLGAFLRKTSLDELPSLLNILFGDMSIVGPRPLKYEFKIFNNYQKQRFNVMPGLTGLAQIKGRNSISWEEKFSFDILYVNNQSFFLDIKIILITIWKVLLRKNINSSDSNTMPEFKGNIR